MWPFRYFPPRLFPSRYWARITGAVDLNALEGRAYGQAQTSAALRGRGTLAANVSSAASVQGDLTAGGTVTVGALAGTVQGSSTGHGTLIDSTVPTVTPGGAFFTRMHRRPALAADVRPLTGFSYGRAGDRAPLTATAPLAGTSAGTTTTAARMRGIHRFARARHEDDFWLMAA